MVEFAKKAEENRKQGEVKIEEKNICMSSQFTGTCLRDCGSQVHSFR